MNGFMNVLCGDGNQIAQIHTGLTNGWSMVDMASNPDRNIRPVFFTESWSSLIDRSVNERDDGRRWMPCLNFLCFLLPPHRDRFLDTSTPICSERRWEIRYVVKPPSVISKSLARLYSMSTHLDRSPFANTCPRWKLSLCTCKEQVTCELNGWRWRFNTQNVVENRRQSSSILIWRGTQKTHQMEVPYMMK